MALMELKVDVLTNKEAKKFYGENKDFKEYVERYSTERKKSIEESLLDYVVRCTGWCYKNRRI